MTQGHLFLSLKKLKIFGDKGVLMRILSGRRELAGLSFIVHANIDPLLLLPSPSKGEARVEG
jgi:hypothetical protein